MTWHAEDLTLYLAGMAPRRIRAELEPMRAACARFGDPERAIPVIHIAGTNGKGSTGAFLRELLRTAGFSVGHYTSPHLTDFTERIQIDGASVSMETLARYAGPLASAKLDLTYFEFATLLAFTAFAEAPCDYAIIEVGMGGRWDATNVVEPRCSVVTPIGLDHQAYLGSTLAAIAGEKCGIIKFGVPVISAPQDPAAMAVIAATCAERQSSLTVAEPTSPELPLGLAGDHQRVNAGVALATATLLCKWGQAPFRALAEVHWPGRCEWLSRDPPILFDGAHNPQAAEALAAYLTEVRDGRDVVCVLGVMRDKDAGEIVRALRSAVDRFVAVTAPTDRGMPARELAQIIRARAAHVTVASTMDEALRPSLNDSERKLYVITGSLYLYQWGRSTLL
ncbi:MAG: bifunctional folylpolyglutamate synthase/dihydrofolate synthase [Deltaproteobacteria bacterium]|nr:bifunctional folylpolyglutamate synthase/dihydrofolate synthase [Deltaproteobacteria bacterium]